MGKDGAGSEVAVSPREQEEERGVMRVATYRIVHTGTASVVQGPARRRAESENAVTQEGGAQAAGVDQGFWTLSHRQTIDGF